MRPEAKVVLMSLVAGPMLIASAIVMGIGLANMKGASDLFVASRVFGVGVVMGTVAVVLLVLTGEAHQRRLESRLPDY